jgi:FAD:protein FMN transferase
VWSAISPAILLLSSLSLFERAEPHMGTIARISCYSSTEAQARQAMNAAFARIAALEQTLSDYQPNSELMQLVARRNAIVSKDLFRILHFGQRLAIASHGAFDLTAGASTHLWRQARATETHPADLDIAAALACRGFQHLSLNSTTRRVQLNHACLQLDAGAIGKGFAASEALATLRRHGITRAMVALSGDYALGAPPPGRRAWRIQSPSRTHTLYSACLSTSGDENQFLFHNGARLSHILDARTGRPRNNQRTITVTGPGPWCDALATALAIAPSPQLLRRFPGYRYTE